MENNKFSLSQVKTSLRQFQEIHKGTSNFSSFPDKIPQKLPVVFEISWKIS